MVNLMQVLRDATEKKIEAISAFSGGEEAGVCDKDSSVTDVDLWEEDEVTYFPEQMWSEQGQPMMNMNN